MEKRKYKLLAIILILSLIFPFFPSVHVFANGLAFLPNFPYSQDSYYNVNNGSFALWQIHNSNYLTYVQTFTPNNISYPNPIIIFNKTWLASNYTYYLDYTYIIDSWDIAGLHSDGFAGTQNIRVPNPNSDFVSDNVVYATLLYTTDNVIWKNGSDIGVYAYTNFYPDGYADPTPTPIPEPEIDTKFPTFINAYAVNYAGSETRYENLYLLCNRYYDEANTQYDYQFFVIPKRFSRGIDWKWHEDITPHYDSYDFINNIFTAYFTNINPDHNYDIHFGGSFFTSSNYKTEIDIYDLNGQVSANAGSVMTETTTRNYQFSISEPSMNYEATAIYLINSDGSTTRLDGDGGETPSTPTPTAIPTAIPQPTTNPNPTATPEPDIKVVQPSDHWWDGLIKPIQYIFVPSSDKMMRTYNNFANKFSVQKPPKFELDTNSLIRPDNVVWNFKHVSLDGSNNKTTQITLIDFKLIDSWLDSKQGQFIIRIVRAVFTLLMWGFLMYIFRKHIATINYTDAETLKDVYRNSGGGTDD